MRRTSNNDSIDSPKDNGYNPLMSPVNELTKSLSKVRDPSNEVIIHDEEELKKRKSDMPLFKFRQSLGVFG